MANKVNRKPSAGSAPTTSSSKPEKICALDVPEFRQSITRCVSAVQGGYWAASVNCHPYVLFTLWNVGTEVKAFHLNFSDPFYMKAELMYTYTMNYLKSINITPIVVLEDGQYQDDGTILPLSHFTTRHLFRYFTQVKILRYEDAEFVPVNSPCSVKDTLTLSSINDMYNAMARAFKNDREGYVADGSMFTTEQELNFMEILLGIVAADQKIVDYSQSLFSAIFEMCRLFWDRQNLSTQQELESQTVTLLARLKELQQLILSEDMFVTNKPSRNNFEVSLLGYIAVLESHPDAPFELFIFSFDYELSAQKIANVKHHDLVDRLPLGCVYKKGTMRVWTGATPKAVTFVPVPCSEKTSEVLADIIDSGMKIKRRDR